MTEEQNKAAAESEAQRKPLIHTSDIVSVWKCPRLGWNHYNHKKGLKEPYANLTVPFSQLASEKLRIKNLPSGKAWDTPERSIELLKQKKGGQSLRFEREGIRTKIPYLLPAFDPSFSELDNRAKKSKIRKIRPEEIEYDIIYPVLSGLPQENLLLMMALDDWILSGMNIKIRSHKIVYVNKDYIRNGDLNPDELLIESSHLLKKSGNPHEESIDEQLEDFREGIEDEIRRAVQILLSETPPESSKIRACLSPRKCAYYGSCFDESSLPDNSIAFLSSAGKRQLMNEQGILALEDTDPMMIEGFPLQYAQIMAARNHGRYLDVRAAESWIGELKYPLIYLDFEWDTFTFPPYDQMFPYDVLCFEFSMHVEQEDGTITHTGFFSEDDGRRAFIETLLENIPREGSVIVYNMEGAEKLRLMQLARQFPEYEADLIQICERMCDLSVLFEKGIFYDLRQRGHYSLKTMLDLFCEGPGYSKLPVKNGLEAIAAYRKLSASKDPVEKQALAKRIDEYCAMDTEAEIIILKALKKEIENQKNTEPSKKKKTSKRRRRRKRNPAAKPDETPTLEE